MQKIEKVCNFSFFLKLINKNFWRNFYILIILLILPIVVLLTNTLNTKSIIIYNQAVVPTLTIDIFIICFFVVPIIYFMFSKSSFMQINNNNIFLKAKLLWTSIFFYFLIFLLCFLYSFLIIVFFGFIKNEYVTINNQGEKIETFNQFLFQSTAVSIPEWGVYNYPSPNWLFFLFACLLNFIYYSVFGLVLATCIKKINNLIFVLIIISLISTSFGGIILNLSLLWQIKVINYISYFNISIYPTLMNYCFYMNIDFNCQLYSLFDYELNFPIYNQFNIILSFIIIALVIILGSILIVYRVYNNLFFKNIWSKKSYLCFDQDENNIAIKIKPNIFNKNHLIRLNLKTQSLSILKQKSYIKLNHIINYLTRHYYMDYFNNIYSFCVNYADSIYLLKYDNLNLFDFSVININRLLKLKQEDLNVRLDFMNDFYEFKRTIQKKQDQYDDYLIKLSYLLNSELKGLIIETPLFTNKQFIKLLFEKAERKKLCILLIYVDKKAKNTKTSYGLETNQEINFYQFETNQEID